MKRTIIRTALIVVDMQNDSLPGGSLAVAGGDEIIPEINRLAKDDLALGFGSVILQKAVRAINEENLTSLYDEIIKMGGMIR